MTRTELARCAAVVIVLAGFGAPFARGEQTRLATWTPSDVQRGHAEGVAVTSLGHLFLAPHLALLGKAEAAGVPSQVFVATSDDAGNVYLATGPDGELVKVTRAGEQTVLFHADEPLLTAIVLLPGGDILAASAPGGRIYRVRPDGKSSVWCETAERYVWALAVNADGTVFAATGDRGRLLKIDRNGHSKVLFDSDEAHLVSLAPTGDGGVWAGGSARGLVYRVDAEGHAFVVYDDELAEAKAIVVLPKGDLVVAFDAPPLFEKRPPALRLRMAGSSANAKDAMTDLDARQTPAMQGVIEGLPSTEIDDTVPLRGKIVRIAQDGAAVELWRSRGEAPFALALDDSHRLLFATGEPAKLWRVEGPDDVALLATLQEGQATALAGSARALVLATSNPAATYRMDGEPARTGTFLAPISDAGSPARWGTIDWRSNGSGGHVELATRTGNCEDPDGTWSAWTKVEGPGPRSAIGNPAGRFLQWRATLTGSASDVPAITAVTASYATRNRAPSIRDLRVDPSGGSINAKATIKWSAADPDGDAVCVDVQARPSGSSAWKSAVRTEAAPSRVTDPSLGNDGSSKDGRATWDTASWDEGIYEVRAIATDQAANAPSEGQEAEAELPILVEIDRTPPTFDVHRKGDAVEVVVEDAMSGVAKLEVVADGRVAFSPRCADGVCDGRRELFKFPAGQLVGSATWTLKATDAAGNMVEGTVPAP